MPSGDGPVVVDTTPLIALSLVERLDLLRSLYGRVIVPPAVRIEIEAGGSRGIGSDVVGAEQWIETRDLLRPSRAELLADLDRGEAEVIALAQEQGARLVVIDERLGRLHARRLGLEVTGTLGVLLAAKQRGQVREIAGLVQRLRDEGIFLSDALVEQTLRIAGE